MSSLPLVHDTVGVLLNIIHPADSDKKEQRITPTMVNLLWFIVEKTVGDIIS